MTKIKKIIGIQAAYAQDDLDIIERVATPYVQFIDKQGYTPIILPHAKEHIPTYVDMCDAFLLIGSSGDIDPQLYGQKNIHAQKINTESDLYEMELLRNIQQQKKPLVAICRGMQLMNILFWGSLHQDIANHLDYEQQDQAVHTVNIQNSTYIQDGVYAVNSIHHQAVATVGKDLQITGIAEDGTIEMIEHTTLPWVGVQWHPEFLLPQEVWNKLFSK